MPRFSPCGRLILCVELGRTERVVRNSACYLAPVIVLIAGLSLARGQMVGATVHKRCCSAACPVRRARHSAGCAIACALERDYAYSSKARCEWRTCNWDASNVLS